MKLFVSSTFVRSSDALLIFSVQWSAPRPSFDYKSVTGPVKLTVLVPLLVVITFGVTVVIVDVILGFPMNSSAAVLLLVLLFNRIVDEPVVIVTTLLLSDDCDLFCKAFKRYSKLQ